MTYLFHSYRSMLTSAKNFPCGPPYPIPAHWKVELFGGRPHAEADIGPADTPLFPRLRYRLHGLDACRAFRRQKGSS